MAEVTSKTEEVKDVYGVTTYTVTRQGDTALTPSTSPAPRSYRIQHSDAIYSIVEEWVTVDEGFVGQYQIDGSVSTEPLETNALFNDVQPINKDNWLKWKMGKPPSPVGWDPALVPNTGSTPGYTTDPKFATFYYWYKNGQESYFAPRVVIRLTRVESTPPDQTNIGKIDTAIAAGITGLQLPTSNGTTVNFILTSARGQQEGDVWRNTYEVTSSSSNGWGWNADIYAQ